MIRKADLRDIDGIIRLAALLNPQWPAGAVRDVLTKSGADVTVYLTGSEIAGFICVEYAADEGCITAIAVDGTCRRRGVGRRLIAFAEQLRNKTNIYLEVEETNTAAIALYGKCGYTQTGKRQNYYGKAAAIIMNKEF